MQTTFKMFYRTLIYKWEETVALYCNYGYGIRMSQTLMQECSSQSNHSQIWCLCHALNSQHPTRALAASPRCMFALFKRHTSNDNDPWSSARWLLPQSPGRLPKTVFSQRHHTGHLGKTELWCFSVAARLKALI